MVDIYALYEPRRSSASRIRNRSAYLQTKFNSIQKRGISFDFVR